MFQREKSLKLFKIFNYDTDNLKKISLYCKLVDGFDTFSKFIKYFKNEIILTLGSGDKMGHVKTMNKFGEKLSTKVITLDGKHKSFLKPRKDVNSI